MENENDFNVETVTQYLSEKRFRELKEAGLHQAPQDLAEILTELEKEDRVLLLRLLPKEKAAETFVELDSDSQADIVEAYNDKELSDILSELYLDDTVDIIEEMPAVLVKRLLRASTPENRAGINRLLGYPKDSAGTIMTPEYVRLKPEMTVAEALAHVRKVAIDKETIYTCYVTADDRTLLGIVTAKALLIADLNARLSDIMLTDVISVNTEEDKEEVAQTLNRYGFLAIPVVDNENRLVGIVTVDDAVDVLSDETEEDFAKMAAIMPTETPYLKTPTKKLFLARIPWLLILMVSATFSSMILGFFESALPAVLILFVPMLMDTGGNSGGQTSVTVIRGISLGEVEFGDILRVAFKEFRVGLCCGGVLGLVAFGKVLLIDRLLMANPAVTVTVALSVACSMLITVVVAKFIGGMLPICAKKLGFDPAVMASPFITTVVDVLSLLLYFVIASYVFGL